MACQYHCRFVAAAVILLKTALCCTGKLSLEDQLEYKINFILSFAFKLIPFVVNIFIWFAVAAANNFSMSINEIVTYYCLGLITSNLLECSMQYEISDDIRSGSINRFLIKPVSYFGYQIMKDMPSRVVFICLGFIPVTLIFLILHRYITFTFSAVNLALYILSLILGYAINFLLNFLLSILSFYFTNVSSLFAAGVIQDIVSGAVFPLSLLPAGAAKVLLLLPFNYTGFFPNAILLNQYSLKDAALQFALGIVWFVVLAAACKAVWNNGLKKYAAFGG